MVLRINPNQPALWRDPKRMQLGVGNDQLVLKNLSKAQEQLIGLLYRGIADESLPEMNRHLGLSEHEANEVLDQVGPLLLRQPNQNLVEPELRFRHRQQRRFHRLAPQRWIHHAASAWRGFLRVSVHALVMNPESENNDFTHVRDGLPSMVDVSAKPSNKRIAVAEVRVELGAEIIDRFENKDLHGPKGPVLQTAIIAGTMAVKKTSDLIPFCHPLPVEHCGFEIAPDETGIVIRCEVATTGRTGVEMEAMTGASVAALTVYDMCKAMNKGIRIEGLHLVSKTGGKSGDFHA